ncbi:hypothetical protein [Paenibacillus herberti]|uniref:Uncharacterized protein n=1 Tax=Paenibacillus herberti TaxID=1619309 RepID=A0A229P3A1_9BACL|nr:hypothetical protein [Paenibacillus herberti]OXM16590.1 hypothetical protein CGZ75_07990 [Paenibacillus herberti]
MKLYTRVLVECLISRTMLIYLLVQTALFVFALKSVPTLPQIANSMEITTLWMSIYKIMANDKEYLFIYFPVFLMLVIRGVSFNNQIPVILRQGVKKWWLSNLWLITALSILISLVIHLFLLASLILKGSTSLAIGSEYLSFFLFSLFINFVGFLIIGLIAVSVILFTSQIHWGIIVPILLLVLFKSIKLLLKAEWLTFEEYVSSTHKIETGNLFLKSIDLLLVGSFLILVILCYFKISIFLKEKDFYEAESNRH